MIIDYVQHLIRKIRQDEKAATAIEYGLIAALISVAAIVAMNAIGESLDTMFSAVSTVLELGASRATAAASSINL